MLYVNRISIKPKQFLIKKKQLLQYAGVNNKINECQYDIYTYKLHEVWQGNGRFMI